MKSTIRSDQVNGTDVYGAGNEHIGSIDHLVINKQSGKIACAVIMQANWTMGRAKQDLDQQPAQAARQALAAI